MLPFLLCGHFSMHGCEETERSKAGYSEKFVISQGFTNDIRCSLTWYSQTCAKVLSFTSLKQRDSAPHKRKMGRVQGLSCLCSLIPSSRVSKPVTPLSSLWWQDYLASPLFSFQSTCCGQVIYIRPLQIKNLGFELLLCLQLLRSPCLCSDLLFKEVSPSKSRWSLV